MFIVCGQKMKKNRLLKVNLKIYHQMSTLEDDEEVVKEEKGLKILTPNELLTRIPILLAQMKAKSNSRKLKNEIRQILYLLYQHNKMTKKSLQQFN